jgi:tryptophanyl-tRNA synthetase
LPHVELTREIARRFNFLYGEVFPVPEPLLTEVPKLLGIDGRKMSKSYGNSIYIADEMDEVKTKVAAMFTDPQRMRRKDPGNPDICNVYSFHRLYSAEEETGHINQECRTAGIGCTDCKKLLGEKILAAMSPIHEKRRQLSRRLDDVRQIIVRGNLKASVVARETMEKVRDAMKI